MEKINMCQSNGNVRKCTAAGFFSGCRFCTEHPTKGCQFFDDVVTECGNPSAHNADWGSEEPKPAPTTKAPKRPAPENPHVIIPQMAFIIKVGETQKFGGSTGTKFTITAISRYEIRLRNNYSGEESTMKGITTCLRLTEDRRYARDSKLDKVMVYYIEPHGEDAFLISGVNKKPNN